MSYVNAETEPEDDGPNPVENPYLYFELGKDGRLGVEVGWPTGLDEDEQCYTSFITSVMLNDILNGQVTEKVLQAVHDAGVNLGSEVEATDILNGLEYMGDAEVEADASGKGKGSPVVPADRTFPS